MPLTLRHSELDSESINVSGWYDGTDPRIHIRSKGVRMWRSSSA